MSKLKSPYNRWNVLEGKEQVDFYDLINLLESNGESIPVEIAHALKKIMYIGQRGHKALVQDLKEAVWSIERFLENIGTDDDEVTSEQPQICSKGVTTNTSLSEGEVKDALEQGYAYTRSLQYVRLRKINKDAIYPIMGYITEDGAQSAVFYLEDGTLYSHVAPDALDLCYLELPTFTVEGE